MHGINNFWMRGLIATVTITLICAVNDISASVLTVIDEVGAVAEVDVSGGGVTMSSQGDEITLTFHGMHVDFYATPIVDEVTADPVVVISDYDYCEGVDESAVTCDRTGELDPWIASKGEIHLFIRDRKTLAFPFTLPSRSEASDIRYGYFQLTSPEVKREIESEDIFHMWWSATPDGPVMSGDRCEWWGIRAKRNVYWTQDTDLASEVCYLGAESRVLYLNFETRCYAPRYKPSVCDDNNRNKSYDSYQFDFARYVKGY